MVASTADNNYKFEFDDANTLPIAANAKIFKHAAVGNNGSGYARPLVAGDPFLGFAEAVADNTGGSAGAKDVQLKPSGRVPLNITGVTGVGNLGASVYAADDQTFTLTQGSNTLIGKIVRWEAGTRAVVRFNAIPAN